MARYKVKHNYRSERDGSLVGPWAKGDEIELDDDVAAYVNVDSPGALVKVQERKPAAAPAAPPAAPPAGGDKA